MKAIRSQLITSNMLMITHNSIGGHLDWNYLVLLAVTKRTTNRDNKKNSNKNCEKTLPKL